MIKKKNKIPVYNTSMIFFKWLHESVQSFNHGKNVWNNLIFQLVEN